jgi:hypothetical protein
METETGGTRASAVRGWIADTAAAGSTESYGDGLREGLLVGLTLARLDPEWSSAALDELIASSHAALAARLAGTPVPAPTLPMLRLVPYARATSILERSATVQA